jgi:hypothetical protein
VYDKEPTNVLLQVSHGVKERPEVNDEFVELLNIGGRGTRGAGWAGVRHSMTVVNSVGCLGWMRSSPSSHMLLECSTCQSGKREQEAVSEHPPTQCLSRFPETTFAEMLEGVRADNIHDNLRKYRSTLVILNGGLTASVVDVVGVHFRQMQLVSITL